MLFSPNNFYINTWNSSSHAFFISQEANFEKKLVITENLSEALRLEELLRVFSCKQVFIINTPTDLFFFQESNEGIFLATPDIFFWNISNKQKQFQSPFLILEEGLSISQKNLIEQLEQNGYLFSRDIWEEGTFYVEGDTCHIHPLKEENILLISIWQDNIDAILEKNDNKKTLINKEQVKILKKLEKEQVNFNIKPNWEQFLPLTTNTLTLFLKLDFVENISIPFEDFSHFLVFSHLKTPLSQDAHIEGIKPTDAEGLKELLAQKKQCWCFTKNPHTLENFVQEHSLPSPKIHHLSHKHLKSFTTSDFLFLSDDILSSVFVKKRFRKNTMSKTNAMLSIKPGSLVVHADHGIGIFTQMTHREFNGVNREYLELHYSEGDKLFVPIEEAAKLSKYIGSDAPKLTRLHSPEWKRVLKKTNEEIEKISQELLQLYASRSLVKGYPFLPFYEKEALFSQAFPYPHTEDQVQSIQEILQDMTQSEPMDRLLMGDVGFGKTEVAVHAAYRAFLNKKQTVYIAPLVTLAYEHFDTFSRRLIPFGVRVAILTRLSTAKEQKTVLDGLRDGTIDCVVGTHRLLSPDIEYRRLWLLVVDEEHKFWVMDKEKINQIKCSIDILSMSATPIPRSLNMALGGVKKISLLHTPPVGKKAISTFLIRFDDLLIKEAIEHELNNGGQVLFLHNRVSTLETVKKRLESILPNKLSIGVVHGKMTGDTIEDTILDFKRGKFNLLLATTVIENGMNFLNANTIFIDRSEELWLSQLHQIRGRVGRSDKNAFCYLIYHKSDLLPETKKRLTTIINHNEPGSGFEIAMHDLELRGAGEVLGVAQSGKTHKTGISLFLQMLESKVQELQFNTKKKPLSCHLEISIPLSISDTLFSSESEKISFFQQLETVEDEDDIEYIRQTFLRDQEKLPPEVENIFLCLMVRIKLSRFGIIHCKKAGEYYLLEFAKTTPLHTIKALLEHIHNSMSFASAHKVRFESNLWKSDIDFLKMLIRKIPNESNINESTKK